MSTDMNCPCEKCICIATCRHKPYDELFKECELVNDYEPSYKAIYSRDERCISLLEEILKPTKWEFVYRHEGDYNYFGKRIKNIMATRKG